MGPREDWSLLASLLFDLKDLESSIFMLTTLETAVTGLYFASVDPMSSSFVNWVRLPVLAKLRDSVTPGSCLPNAL